MVIQLFEPLYNKVNEIRDILHFVSAVVSNDQSLVNDVVNILDYLCEKLKVCASVPHGRQTEPLLLEGIYAILSNIPVSIRENVKFTDIIWYVYTCLIILFFFNIFSLIFYTYI